MTQPEPPVHPVQAAAYAYVGGFVEQLARAGLRHVVLCPGSRSTPLAMMCMDQDGLKVWLHIDERSAGFFALGLAKATETPVALVATSGTAVANFLPAVTEAYFGRVPLLLLTADRPPELRDVGTNQTIFQAGLFGRHAKWAVDMPLPEEAPAMVAYARAAAARAFAAAKDAPAGPVQINFPFREPLIPLPGSEPTADPVGSGRATAAPVVSPADSAGSGSARSGSAEASGAAPASERARRLERYRMAGMDRLPQSPTVETGSGRRVLPAEKVQSLVEELVRSRRTLIVCGPDTPREARPALLQLAARLGVPLLADPLSGLRTTGQVADEVIDAYDVFLRFGPVRDAVPPSLVLRFGALPVSKPLFQYLEQYRDTPQIVVDEGDGWRDPGATASRVLHADPALLCGQLLAALEKEEPARMNPWPLVWRRLNISAREGLEEQLRIVEQPFEGLVFDVLASMSLEGVNLFVGNSMPIRDMDAFFPAVDKPLRVFGNRGVSGIDGVVSSALGVAAARQGPTLLVLGDLSFYHDLNGLLAAKRHDLDLTVVLVNNDGGGIFSFLPQADHGRHFEELFGTPTGLDFEPAVGMYGGAFVRTSDKEELGREVEAAVRASGLHVVEYVTSRADNAARHRALMAAVGEKIVSELGSIFRSAGGGR